MAKFLLVPDVHLSDKPPSSCTATYTDDLFDLLHQAAGFAVHCEAVIFAGDVFHIKAPSRTSHRLVLRMIAALREFGKPVYVVPGNHDLQHDRLDSLQVGQPLGVLIEAGVVRLLEGWGGVSEDMPAPSPFFPVYGVPWLQGYGNYAETGEVIDARVGQALAAYREAGSAALVVTHAPLYPPGQELTYEFFPAERWAEAMGWRGSVFYGHVHEPHGVYGYDTEHEITFCNNGALSRGSLHEYNLERQVGVTIWDSETGNFDFVPLQARPASEVFRLAEKQQVTDMQGRLDEFLAGVSHTQLESVSVESVLAHLAAQPGWGTAEQQLAVELLQGAGDAS